MKEKALEQFINEITSGLQSAKEFAGAQIPDVAKQAVHYAMASEAFEFVVFAMIIFMAIHGHRWIQAKVKAQKSGYEEPMFHYFWCAPMGVVGFIGAVSSAETFLKVTLAPKVWLLEYVAHLAHGGGCSK